MRPDCRKINLKTVINKISKIGTVKEVYIFGSRAYETGSVRSDIDLLVYAPGKRIDAEIYDVIKSEKWLDIFQTTDKRYAFSIANSSAIERDDLIKKVDAICLWKRSSGFTKKIEKFAFIEVLRKKTPEMTCLPIYSDIESEFYKQYGHGAIFVIMPFSKEYDCLYNHIKTYLKEKKLTAIRADEYKFDNHVWPNVQLYLECCRMAIALFPYSDSGYNPNVALEVGYMLSKGGKICLLKEDRVEKMFSDISSIMYNTYKQKSYKKDISKALDKWIENGFK